MTPPATSRIGAAFERALLALWVGALWTVGFLVAPVLFAELDRHTAGTVAGILFHYLNYGGLAIGGLLLLRAVAAPGRSRIVPVLLVAMLLIILVNEFGLAPQISALRDTGFDAGSETARRFGLLHGVASVLYLINALFGLVLLVAGTEGAKAGMGQSG